MEKIEKGNMLHRAFSVFLFNSKYELLLQVYILITYVSMMLSSISFNFFFAKSNKGGGTLRKID